MTDTPNLLTLHQPAFLNGIRHDTEQRELAMLSPFAVKSSHTTGRPVEEPPCPIRTAFQRDRDRILHAKAFRRLKGKTQVFISPVGDHYRTRLTHTLEVSQIARTVARALRLNEDLTEAIALGHDIGHPPFGHSGEDMLNQLAPQGFQHARYSLRIVNVLEPLNLTHEVLAGMLQQAEGGAPTFLESKVVEIADRVAYLNHDVEDATRAGLMTPAQIPAEIQEVLGKTAKERLTTLVIDLIETSQRNMDANKPEIAMSPPVWQAMMRFRKWMFQTVYLSVTQNSQKEKVRRVITGLYDYFSRFPECIPEEGTASSALLQGQSEEQRVVDYIAGMTDRFAIDLYLKTLMPISQPH